MYEPHEPLLRPEKHLGKIVFVADDQILSLLIQNAFKKADFYIYTTNIAGVQGLLREQNIDLLLYDYKLSDTDNFQLLKKIKQQYPDILRVILGGYMEQPSVVKALTDGVAVSYFTKPKDANATDLKNGLTRMLGIRKSFKNKKLLGLLNSIEKLPHLPLLYQEYMRSVERGASFHEFAEIISKDVSVAASVLHVTNSAFYGLTGTASLEHAVMYLGVDAVREIVLAVSLANSKPLSPEQMNYFFEIIKHSAMVNKYLLYIYNKVYGEQIDNNYKSIAITHDIGKIILLQYFPERFNAIIKQMDEYTALTFYNSELSLGYSDTTHAEIGAYLLDLWNLPEICVQMALFHHEIDIPEGNFKNILQVIHLANEMVTLAEKNVDPESLHFTMLNYGYLLKEESIDLYKKIKRDYQTQAKKQGSGEPEVKIKVKLWK